HFVLVKKPNPNLLSAFDPPVAKTMIMSSNSAATAPAATATIRLVRTSPRRARRDPANGAPAPAVVLVSDIGRRSFPLGLHSSGWCDGRPVHRDLCDQCVDRRECGRRQRRVVLRLCSVRPLVLDP